MISYYTIMHVLSDGQEHALVLKEAYQPVFILSWLVPTNTKDFNPRSQVEIQSEPFPNNSTVLMLGNYCTYQVATGF